MITRSISRIYCAYAWIVLLLFTGAPLHGAQRTWDGGGTDWDWRNSANWDGTTRLDPIEQGDTLVFPEGPTKLINTNDFGANTNFNALIYSGDDYRTYGNRIGLSNGVSVTHASGATALHLPILLRRDQTFSVSSASAFLHIIGEVNIGLFDLTFDGAGGTVLIAEIVNSRLGGRGSVRKTGSGRLTIFQQTDHDAPTIVSGGTLAVEHRMTNSVVTVQSGGTLRGSGRIGGLNAVGGLVHPGGTTPDALECRGDASLAAGSTLRIRINGTTAGVTYDQLDVVGAVTLGGTLELIFGYTPAVGERFTIIENDGSDDITGTFAGMPEGHVFTANGRPFKISYGGRIGTFGRENDVTIEAIPALSVWDGGGGLNRFWSQPLNWVGDMLPQLGDDVQFAHAGSTPLITVNDFPAGRQFGSIIFAGGIHRLEGGNMADLRGGVEVPLESDIAILMPVTLKTGLRLTEPGRLMFGSTVALSANQTFWTLATNAMFYTPSGVGFAQPFLTLTGQVNLAGHDLGIHTEPAFAFDQLSTSVRLSATVVGPGSITKRGAGSMYNSSASIGVPFAILEGRVAEGDYADHVLVSTGAIFSVSSFGSVHNLEVRGGQFTPGRGTPVGSARFADNSVYDTAITFVNTSPTDGFHDSGYIYTSGLVELAGCTLNLRVDDGPERIPAGRRFGIVEIAFGGTLTGTFNGLPEGARFTAGGYVFTITYTNDVAIYADLPFVWDGGASGNNLWTAAANWVGDVAPIAGAALIFPANATKLGLINDFPANTVFRSLTFERESYLVVGNSFRVSEGIYNDFQSGETIVQSDFTVAAGSSSEPFECRVANASRLQLEGSVTAAGSAYWSKTGTGTLRFTGTTPNVQSSVKVMAGELELDKDSGVNAISTRLEIGDGTNDVRVTLLGDHQIADSATVHIRNRGRLDLNGNDEAINSLQGEGTVSLNGRLARLPRLTVASGNFSGAIVGDGALTKIGSFSLSLSGENTYTGLTIVEGGTLSVSGSLSSSTVRIDGGTLGAEGLLSNSTIRLNGGGLRGRGTVGAVVADLGGTLQPGSGGVDFQVALRTRDVTLNSATTFRAFLTSIDPGYENHKLQVAGAVNLGGSVLSVDLNGNFRPGIGRSFVIIENDGSDAINGTFAGLAEGAIFGGDGLPFTITYTGGTGNDVVITRVVGEPASFSSATALGNGQVRFEGIGTPGVVYAIQAASNLNPIIQWAPLFNRTGNASGIFEILETNAFQRPMRFYRAVLP